MGHLFKVAGSTLALVANLAIVSTSHAGEPISPITAPTNIHSEKAELGKKLFFDPRLSRSGFISCNSCHNLSMGGADNLPTSIGDHWQQGPINSPTVLNASLNVAQFWDGRAADLKEQAAGPIANPGEMASNHTLAVSTIASIPGYRQAFNEVFGTESVTIDTITDAIAEFEKTLKTPNAPFDLWLKGNEQALSQQAVEGYGLFKASGCTACHNGEAVGGSSFQKFGILAPYATDNPAEGRIAVTGNQADRFSFKVPTLRNVELTYPYFHDGGAATLSEAVDIMGKLQLGRHFSEQENAAIVAFLKSLTGDQPSFGLPALPPSGPDTPRPKPFSQGADTGMAH